MLLPHLYTDDHGHSVFGDVDLKMAGTAGQDGGFNLAYLSASQRVNSSRQDVSHWRIGHALPGHFVDFAPSDGNTFIAVFSGQMHLTASNGEARQLTRGDMMLAQDIGGQGHMTRFIGQEACNYLLVTMPGGFK